MAYLVALYSALLRHYCSIELKVVDYTHDFALLILCDLFDRDTTLRH